MRYFLVAVVLCVSVLTPQVTRGEVFFSLDQGNVVSPWTNRNIGIQPFPRQSFIPTLTKMNRVDLRLADAGAAIGDMADVEVRLYSGSSNTPLATSSRVTLNDGAADYVDFDYVSFQFDQPVSVNPGFQYRIEAVNTSTQTGINFAWTAGQNDSYSRGTSFNGPSSGADFLFRTGLVQENRLDLVPQTIGSISQLLTNGTQTISMLGFIDDVSPPLAPLTATYRQTRAIAEYDLSQLVGRSDLTIESATLSGSIFKSNSLNTGDRSIDISFYEGDNLLSTSDYDALSSSLGTTVIGTAASFVDFNFDVKNQLTSILAGGGDVFGTRYTPLGYQATSALSDFVPPVLTITVVAVPEPSSCLLSLVAMGVITLRLRTKRSSRRTRTATRLSKFLTQR